MKAPGWLRASSLLSLVFALGHTLGASQSWSPVGGTDVLRAIATFHFNVEGANWLMNRLAALRRFFSWSAIC